MRGLRAPAGPKQQRIRSGLVAAVLALALGAAAPGVALGADQTPTPSAEELREAYPLDPSQDAGGSAASPTEDATPTPTPAPERRAAAPADASAERAADAGDGDGGLNRWVGALVGALLAVMGTAAVLVLRRRGSGGPRTAPAAAGQPRAKTPLFAVFEGSDAAAPAAAAAERPVPARVPRRPAEALRRASGTGPTPAVGAVPASGRGRSLSLLPAPEPASRAVAAPAAEAGGDPMPRPEPARTQPRASGSEPGSTEPRVSGSEPERTQPRVSGSDPGSTEPRVSGPEPERTEPRVSGSEPGSREPRAPGSQPERTEPRAPGSEPAWTELRASDAELAQTGSRGTGTEPASTPPREAGTEPVLTAPRESGPEPAPTPPRATGTEPAPTWPQESGPVSASAAEPAAGRDVDASPAPAPGPDTAQPDVPAAAQPSAGASTGTEAPEPPDPGTPWTAAVQWRATDDPPRFVVVASAGEGTAEAEVARSEPVRWPPAGPQDVAALNAAVAGLEALLLRAGWSALEPGDAWYAKRFGWHARTVERPAAAPSPPASPRQSLRAQSRFAGDELATPAPRGPGSPPAGTELAGDQGAGRFVRRTPWPEDTEDLWRCEIKWDAGYKTSRFTAAMRRPGTRRGRIVAASAPFKWMLMAEPDDDPAVYRPAVDALAGALEAAGWERVEPGPEWWAERFVWRRDEPPPDHVESESAGAGPVDTPS